MVDSSIQLSCKNRTVGPGEDQFEEVDSLILHLKKYIVLCCKISVNVKFRKIDDLQDPCLALI